MDFILETGLPSIEIVWEWLAVLIASCWCADVSPDKLNRQAEIVLEQASKINKEITPELAYPATADSETRSFLDYWFDPKNRCELTALAYSIEAVNNRSERNLLWCALSRLIITKKSGVSLAMDVSHSRPHRKYDEAPIHPLDKFMGAVKYVLKRSPFVETSKEFQKAMIKRADARALPFHDKTADMIITSPPYLNAIDYLRGHKLSLVWMGHSIKDLRYLRSNNVGAEYSEEINNEPKYLNVVHMMLDDRAIDKKHLRMVLKYVRDMDKVIGECRRILKDEGQAIFVIGDCTVGGIFVKNSEGLVNLAESHQLKLLSRIERKIPGNRRYLPPPNLDSSGEMLQNRMREELILRFAS